jgi:hypothetical protein
VADGYFVKYFASVVAMLVYSTPILISSAQHRPDTETLTRDYIRSMRLLSNTSRCVYVYVAVALDGGTASRL